jgi:peptidoglycan/LPS O-acetylase OafA/YrhL
MKAFNKLRAFKSLQTNKIEFKSMTHEKSIQQRNLRIDSFRGWGCLLILVLHSSGPYAIGKDLFFSESDVTNLGANIVSLFFCISGYLVYQSLESLSTQQPHYRRIFYIRRFFRIIPLWWALIITMYFLGAFPKTVFLSQFFLYFGFLSYLPAFLPIVPAWSLFVEENFYLLLPWIHRFMSNLSKVLIAFFLSIICCVIWKNGAAFLGVPSDNYFISRNILSKMPFFISGIFLVHLERSLKKTQESFLQQNKFLMSVLGLISFVMIFHHYYIYSFIFVPLLCFICISPGNIFSMTEKSGFLRFAGERCYAIYILHAPIDFLTQKQQLFLKSFLRLEDKDFQWFCVHAIFIMILTLIVSELSYRCIEQPFLKWGYRLSDHWKIAKFSPPAE